MVGQLLSRGASLLGRVPWGKVGLGVGAVGGIGAAMNPKGAQNLFADGVEFFSETTARGAGAGFKGTVSGIVTAMGFNEAEAEAFMNVMGEVLQEFLQETMDLLSGGDFNMELDAFDDMINENRYEIWGRYLDRIEEEGLIEDADQILAGLVTMEEQGHKIPDEHREALIEAMQRRNPTLTEEQASILETLHQAGAGQDVQQTSGPSAVDDDPFGLSDDDRPEAGGDFSAAASGGVAAQQAINPDFVVSNEAHLHTTDNPNVRTWDFDNAAIDGTLTFAHGVGDGLANDFIGNAAGGITGAFSFAADKVQLDRLFGTEMEDSFASGYSAVTNGIDDAYHHVTGTPTLDEDWASAVHGGGRVVGVVTGVAATWGAAGAGAAGNASRLAGTQAGQVWNGAQVTFSTATGTAPQVLGGIGMAATGGPTGP